jgi:GT2 family glycosyltransferase
LLDVDLEQPLPDIRLSGPEAGRDYVGARVLLRLHAQPLGYLDLGADGGHRAAADYAPAIWAQFGPQIVEHLRQDGLEPPAGLDPAGLRLVGQPRCRIDRERARESAPAASVIVPTRERPDRLARCLEALARQDYPRFEVIVVDSPVTDATAELVRAGVPGLATLRYVRENGRGPARARNAGLRVATGDVVAFVDDDAVPDVHWLTELVRGLSAGANVACVTGLILPLELETPAQVWFEQFGGFSKGFTRRVYDLDRHRPADRLFPYTAARFGSGASMAFRHSVLLDLGGFDPLVGGEDADAYFRVISGGYQLVYQPTALVYHEHRREYEALRAQLFLYGRCLAAFLLKCVLDDPRRLVALVPKLPGGVWYALYPKSAKNRAKDATYPSELTALELKGMALGGWSYLRARWRARPDRPIEGAPARRMIDGRDGVPDGVPNGIPQGTSQSPQSAVCKRVG